MGASLWLRWSWRDLRSRWLLMIAIALVIAIGTGIYSGLGSLETWRVKSNDASFEALNAHDLEITLPEGARVPAGALAAAARSLPDPSPVEEVSERLIAPAQLEVQREGEETLLVSAVVVGSALGPDGPPIDGVAAEAGRGLRRSDAGRPVAVIDASFADFHGLPATGRLRVAGGAPLRSVGHGRSPEYFLITRPGGGEFGGAEASFTSLYTSIEVARRIAGAGAVANNAVLTLRPGADANAVRDQLQALIRRTVPGAEVTGLEDEPAHRLLYRDAEGDQQLFNIFALLILAGAAFATFNLSTRIVEAQRREIGIGMALGTSPRELAIRPLLLGAQIAVAGTVLGLGIGLLSGEIWRDALEELLPLPEMRTPFEPQVFARGALLGLLLPLAATALPVWRGVRVEPVDAIRTGFRSARSSGLASISRRLRLPGSALVQLPLRNVLRAPRRTALTAFGVAAVIGVLIGFSALVDSFLDTIDRSEAETAGETPARVTVALDDFHPVGSGLVRDVAGAPGVARAEPRLRVRGELGSGNEEFDVVIGLLDGRSPIWHPTVVEGSPPVPGEPGVLISREAADDLGVGVGDRVSLTYPRRTGPESFVERTDTETVAGIHPDPFRNFVYMDQGQAQRLGLAGRANEVAIEPAPGVTEQQLRRQLFSLAGVASAERATASAQFVRERMNDFLGILRIVELFALVLALLIAFNSSSISADERARENATLLAFGVRVRGAVGVSIGESLMIGVLGTIGGIALGYGILQWVLSVTLPRTLPDLGVAAAIGPQSLLTAIAVGVLGVGLAPLLTARRIRRMDVPSTLRVVE